VLLEFRPREIEDRLFRIEICSDGLPGPDVTALDWQDLEAFLFATARIAARR
jgi:hypothetical protein